MDRTKEPRKEYEWWKSSGIKYEEFNSVLKSIFPNITPKDVVTFGIKMSREAAGDDTNAHRMIDTALSIQPKMRITSHN